MQIHTDDRQGERQIDEHQNETGVEQPDLAREQIDRQREHDRADHAVRYEPEPEVRLAPELEARERIGGGRSERHGERCRRRRHDQRIEHRRRDGVSAKMAR